MRALSEMSLDTLLERGQEALEEGAHELALAYVSLLAVETAELTAKLKEMVSTFQFQETRHRFFGRSDTRNLDLIKKVLDKDYPSTETPEERVRARNFLTGYIDSRTGSPMSKEDPHYERGYQLAAQND